ncbi:MAG: Ni/Fe-hydrogenase cytochrome b subunit [Alphaproteobacteria bacterium]|nr:Ni/Fe-hydrogenase cytochrome b subunit [Alphaproteobacteria bacterium]
MSIQKPLSSPHRPAPLGGSLVTPVTVICALLSAIAVYFLAKRFIFGLGAVTNINDGFPWGVWIAWDVVIGTALACGGYSMALLVYIMNKGRYHPLVRPALLASLFGYTLGGASVMFDLGRYWNFYHIFTPGLAHPDSVMFEVAVCISLYIMVMWVEFSPAFFDRFGWTGMKTLVERLMFAFIGLGVLLPSMHQSSLGSLLVVFGHQIHPLWQTPLLPLLFLLSAIAMGFAVVVFESTLATSGFRLKSETRLLAGIASVMNGLLAAYLVVRFGDLAVSGKLGLAFSSGFLSLMFWLEIAFFALPLLLLQGARRNQARCLFIGAVSMLLGGGLYRMDGFLVAYQTGAGWTYFPSLPELMVTIGLIAFEVLAYIVLVRVLPVLHPNKSEPAVAAAAAAE